MFLCIFQPENGTSPYVAFCQNEEEGEDEMVTKIPLSKDDPAIRAFASICGLAIEASDRTPKLELLLTQLLHEGIRMGKDS